MAEIQCFQASDSDFPWAMAAGKQNVKARSAANGYQGPGVYYPVRAPGCPIIDAGRSYVAQTLP